LRAHVGRRLKRAVAVAEEDDDMAEVPDRDRQIKFAIEVEIGLHDPGGCRT